MSVRICFGLAHLILWPYPKRLAPTHLVLISQKLMCIVDLVTDFQSGFKVPECMAMATLCLILGFL